MPTTPPRPILVTPWAQPSPLAYKRQRLSSGSLLAPVHRRHSSEAPSNFSGSWEGFLGDSSCAPRNLTTHARQPATQPSLDSLRDCFPLDTDGDLSMFSQGASMLNGIEGWDMDWPERSHMQDIVSLPSVSSSGPESYTTPLPTSTLAPTSAIHPAVSAVSNAALLSHSIERLEAQSQDLRVQLMEQEQGNKQTSDTYARHVTAYETWWDADQASAVASGLSKIAIPAFPIIVSKVAMFLKYETTREKKKRGAVGESVAGSSVGKEHIKQIISALEHKRLHHQHLYRDIPDAQISLRGDVRIRVFESAAKKNEGERIRKSQALKAAGTSSDTYTTDELTRCSRHLLGVTGGQTSISIRDRAMLLLPAATAFRGESTRMLLLSDMFMGNVSLIDRGVGRDIPVLGMLANNAKHNQTGRVDEHGALRSRLVDLCPVGAVAMLLFSHFHIQGHPVPRFAPDFSKPGYGEFGYREWYDHHVFYSKNPSVPMTYSNHLDRINILHASNGIHIVKKTHALRPLAAQKARTHGASIEGTKILGGWSVSGSYRNCYDRAFPVDALLGAAMFDANKPENYFLARDCLNPSSDLLMQVFPWIEAEEVALEAREQANRLATDIALRQFLRLLKWLRLVIVQDCAVLFAQCPSYTLFKYAPFSTPEFRRFSASSLAAVASAEEGARLALEQLPHHLVATLEGVLTNASLQQQQERDTNAARWAQIEARMSEIHGMFDSAMSSKNPRQKRRKVSEPPKTVPPSPPSVTVPPNLGPHPTSSLSFTPSSSSPTVHNITIHFSGENVPSQSGAVISTSTTSPQAALLSPPNPVLPMPLTTQPPALVPPASSTTWELDAQRNTWAALTRKYGESRLRAHQWEWTCGDWLPYYVYQPVTTIAEVWIEWADGLGGYLPVRDLMEKWGARWRRNNAAQKTNGGRRSKIVKLVDALSRKPRWDVDLALSFIEHTYGRTSQRKFSHRQFSDYLSQGNGAGHSEALAAAESYSRTRL